MLCCQRENGRLQDGLRSGTRSYTLVDRKMLQIRRLYLRLLPWARRLIPPCTPFVRNRPKQCLTPILCSGGLFRGATDVLPVHSFNSEGINQ